MTLIHFLVDREKNSATSICNALLSAAVSAQNTDPKELKGVFYCYFIISPSWCFSSAVFGWVLRVPDSFFFGAGSQSEIKSRIDATVKVYNV